MDLLAFVRGLSDAALIAFLRRLAAQGKRRQLMVLFWRFGLPDCRCPMAFAACPCGREDCPIGFHVEPCRHNRAKAGHFSLAVQAELFLALWPKVYAERPGPADKSRVLLPHAMVTVMERRAAKGCGLRHLDALGNPDDYLRRRRGPDPEENRHMQRPGSRRINGSDMFGALKIFDPVKDAQKRALEAEAVSAILTVARAKAEGGGVWAKLLRMPEQATAA